MTSLDAITSYAQTFEMPFMTYNLAESNPFNPTDYVIYVRPPHTEAMFDVIVDSNWQNLFFIYDSDEGELAGNKVERTASVSRCLT